MGKTLPGLLPDSFLLNDKMGRQQAPLTIKPFNNLTIA
jgi:hypothetical protein